MSNTSAASKRSPLRFFLLVFVLSLPLWVLGGIVGSIGLPMNMRVIELVGAFVPLMAALILVYREEKFGGVRLLLKRVFDYKRIKPRIWYVPIVFLMPILVFFAQPPKTPSGYSGASTTTRPSRRTQRCWAPCNASCRRRVSS